MSLARARSWVWVWVCVSLGFSTYVYGETVKGPGKVKLEIDSRLHFPVPAPSLIPLIHDGQATLSDLVKEGEYNWFNAAPLDGEPFGVPESIFDFFFGPTGTSRHTKVIKTFEAMTGESMPYFEGEDLPRGLVRTHNVLNPLVTQTCSACHTGTVNSHLIPGLGNKWYDQKAVITYASLLLKSSLPLLKLKGESSKELLHQTETQIAKLERYKALYGIGCKDLAPGMVTGARIWQISSKLLYDPAQLATPEGQKKFLCGTTKPPPLNTLKFRNIYFWDGSVNTQWVSHWPLFDFFGFNDYQKWEQKISTRVVQSVDAFLTFGTHSPSWKEIMGTSVDEKKAARGYKIFHHAQSCASCHGTYSEAGMLRTFKPNVVPLNIIGTDRERSDAAYDELMEAFSKYGWAYVPRVDTLEKDYPKGYQSYPLCSTFLNYPYLHTGSVANLDELFLPEEKRSTKFWLSDVIDKEKVGFYTTDDKPKLSEPGLSNRAVQREFRKELSNGHSGEKFGTTLSATERGDLVEYLKTLRCPEGS